MGVWGAAGGALLTTRHIPTLSFHVDVNSKTRILEFMNNKERSGDTGIKFVLVGADTW